MLSDEESPNELLTTNSKVDTSNAFNVFSMSDDDQNEPKNKYDISLSSIILIKHLYMYYCSKIVRLRHEKRRRKLPELPKHRSKI